MSQQVFEIKLPFFPGFYESVLYNSDTLYYEVHNEENMEYYRDVFNDNTLTENDLDIDFEAYKHDVINAFIDAFSNSNCLPNFIDKICFRELVSPHYYNYETDKIYVSVHLSDDWKNKVLAFMNSNGERLSKRILKEWTSRDGFISFLPNSLSAWRKIIENDDKIKPALLECIIKYMMEFANEDIYYELICSTLENIYVGDYIVNVKEEK